MLLNFNLNRKARKLPTKDPDTRLDMMNLLKGACSRKLNSLFVQSIFGGKEEGRREQTLRHLRSNT